MWKPGTELAADRQLLARHPTFSCTRCCTASYPQQTFGLYERGQPASVIMLHLTLHSPDTHCSPASPSHPTIPPTWGTSPNRPGCRSSPQRLLSGTLPSSAIWSLLQACQGAWPCGPCYPLRSASSASRGRDVMRFGETEGSGQPCLLRMRPNRLGCPHPGPLHAEPASVSSHCHNDSGPHVLCSARQA
jgi:hypothetical protein